jgi:hypothetical protein
MVKMITLGVLATVLLAVVAALVVAPILEMRANRAGHRRRGR